MPVKAPAYVPVLQRWSIWGAAYGGQNRTDGDPTVGSNDLRATAAGFAAGADYRVSRDTVVGLAVAVGETRWNLSAGLGKGNSNVAQVGGYASTRWDNLYLSGAVAFAWHKAETERTVTVAGTDRLEADFNATSIGGRVEGGYFTVSAERSLWPDALRRCAGAVAAHAGLQRTRGARLCAVRAGVRVADHDRHPQRARLLGRHPLPVRGQHDGCCAAAPPGCTTSIPAAASIPAFQTLPGASFTIDGAAAPRDAALTSAVARDAAHQRMDADRQDRRRVRQRLHHRGRNRHREVAW